MTEIVRLSLDQMVGGSVFIAHTCKTYELTTGEQRRAVQKIAEDAILAIDKIVERNLKMPMAEL